MSKPKPHKPIPNSFDPAFNYIIPSFVFNYDETLICSKAKMLYGALNAICARSGYCCATDAYLCEIYGFKNRSLTRYIKQLKHQGLIKIYYADGNFKRRVIKIVKFDDIESSPKSNLFVLIKARQKELKLIKNRHSSQYIKVVESSRLLTEPVSKCSKTLPPKSAKDIAISGQHNITKNINVDLGTSLTCSPINEVPKSRPDNAAEVVEYIKKYNFEIDETEKLANEFIAYYEKKNWISKFGPVEDWKQELGFYCAMRTLGNLKPF